MRGAKIRRVSQVGTRPTKDIEVNSSEHLFFGNGIATSNSHGISYAINAYLSAYAKAHFPKVFFASYLRFAKDKIDPQAEIKELVQNATEMDIDVRPPDLRLLNKHFILKNNKVYFGLTDIKGVGASVFDKLTKILSDKNLEELHWLDYLLEIFPNINSNAAKALMQTGALSYLKLTRNYMLFEFSLVSNLTKKELKFVVENKQPTLKKCLEYLLENGKINKNRKEIVSDLIGSLASPPYSLQDSPEWLADSEDSLLGCSITCGKVDMYDISMCNTTCRDFKNGERTEKIILGGEIDHIGIVKTKNGQNPGSEMAFVNMLDSTGLLDSVIFFPDQYRKFKNILFQGNIIIVAGNRSKNGDSLIVDKAYIAKT